MTLVWTPAAGDADDGALTVSSANHVESVDVAVAEPSGGGGTLDGDDDDNDGRTTGGTGDAGDDGASGGPDGGSSDGTDDGASGGGSGGGGGGGGGGQSAPATDDELPPAPPATLAVENATLLSGVVTAGESVPLEVTVRNRGTQTEQFRLVLAANGTTLADETVAVAADSTQTIRLEPTVADPGTYTVTLNGEPVGDLTVTSATADSAPPAAATGETVSAPSEPSDDTGEADTRLESDRTPTETPATGLDPDAEVLSDPGTSASAPGFSLLVGILAVVLFAGTAAWRRRRSA
jgi:hypothetical protein